MRSVLVTWTDFLHSHQERSILDTGLPTTSKLTALGIHTGAVPICREDFIPLSNPFFARSAQPSMVGPRRVEAGGASSAQYRGTIQLLQAASSAARWGVEQSCRLLRTRRGIIIHKGGGRFIKILHQHSVRKCQFRSLKRAVWESICMPKGFQTKPCSGIGSRFVPKNRVLQLEDNYHCEIFDLHDPTLIIGCTQDKETLTLLL